MTLELWQNYGVSHTKITVVEVVPDLHCGIVWPILFFVDKATQVLEPGGGEEGMFVMTLTRLRVIGGKE